jgi:leucyl/phenylalanyl-tRNA--protein transferase
VSNGRVIWLSADDPPSSFPPVSSALAEPDGLLAAGGDLSSERLLYAYRHGIFPWYDEGQPLLWWSPDPRCVFMPGDYRVSRRMQRELRRSNAEVRTNTAFSEVVQQCAGPRKSEQGTWITPAIMSAFDELHKQGWAHSIEVWESGALVGGLYGLAIGKVFFGESMFSQRPNASKIALLFVADKLEKGDIELLDCQVVSGHLMSLGARTTPRSDFVKHLESACHPATRLPNWLDSPLAGAQLLLS